MIFLILSPTVRGRPYSGFTKLQMKSGSFGNTFPAITIKTKPNSKARITIPIKKIVFSSATPFPYISSNFLSAG